MLNAEMKFVTLCITERRAFPYELPRSSVGTRRINCFKLTGLGTWKHTSPILAGLFVRDQHGSKSYVASYAPITTALMTNKNPAQILGDYLFPGALIRK